MDFLDLREEEEGLGVACQRKCPNLVWRTCSLGQFKHVGAGMSIGFRTFLMDTKIRMKRGKKQVSEF